MIWNLTISLIAAALLANIETADAQQAPDPRIADLVQAGKVRVGLFSTQYAKDPVNRIVVAKGHPGWIAYVFEFVEEAKASGLVQKVINRDGTFAFQVPPPGDPK